MFLHYDAYLENKVKQFSGEKEKIVPYPLARLCMQAENHLTYKAGYTAAPTLRWIWTMRRPHFEVWVNKPPNRLRLFVHRNVTWLKNFGFITVFEIFWFYKRF